MPAHCYYCGRFIADAEYHDGRATRDPVMAAFHGACHVEYIAKADA